MIQKSISVRQRILLNIISFNGEIDFLKNELSEFPFDSEVELVILSKHDLISAINKCLNAEISQNELTEWANILEVRDDEDENNMNTISNSGSAYVYEDCRSYKTIDITSCGYYTSPSGNSTSGVYSDTLTNAAMCDSIITI